MSIDLTQELFNEAATAVVDEVEGAAATAGELPPGKYHAQLNGVARKEIAGMPVDELSFVVIGGPMRGRKVRYSLWLGVKETDSDGNPKSAEQIEEHKKRSKNEFWHAAGVLGLAQKVGGVYKFAPGKRDFRDCLGAECIVETSLRSYKTQQGDDKKAAEVKMFGVYAVNDPKCASVAKAPAGSAPPVGAATGVGVASQDLSDLV